MKKEEIPSVHDKEMFLRFFEELSQMIDRKYIDLDDVERLFAYYFIILWEDELFFWDKAMCAPFNEINDAQKDNWGYARALHEKLEKKIKRSDRKNINAFLNEFQEKYKEYKNL